MAGEHQHIFRAPILLDTPLRKDENISFFFQKKDSFFVKFCNVSELKNQLTFRTIWKLGCK